MSKCDHHVAFFVCSHVVALTSGPGCADPQVTKLTANSAVQRILPGQEASQMPAEEILAQLAQSSGSAQTSAHH